MELVEKLREVLKARGLQTSVRSQRAGCLDACSFGPSMVIYPDGTYYGNVSIDDVERIVEQHVVNNQIVEELELKF